jgi:hypothetical protein
MAAQPKVGLREDLERRVAERHAPALRMLASPAPGPWGDPREGTGRGAVPSGGYRVY